MALTGERGTAADAMWVGYGTHHVEHTRLDALLDALAAADWGSGSPHEVTTRVLSSFATDAGPAPLRSQQEIIDRCFKADRMEDILEALTAEGTEWAETTRATLARMSPTSLKVTLRQLRVCRSLCRSLPYPEVAAIEYRLSQNTTALPDFREGIRAMLVDKDQRPLWNPASLAEVRDEDVEACFIPLTGKEWRP